MCIAKTCDGIKVSAVSYALRSQGGNKLFKDTLQNNKTKQRGSGIEDQ